MRKYIYVVVQEGGTSTELYVQGFGTKREAGKFKRSCAEASYRTTEPIKVIAQLHDAPEFFPTIETVVRAVAVMQRGRIALFG